MKTPYNGFTLVELIIVVVIAAILATIAVPSFTSLIRDKRQYSAAGQLFGDLHMAKSEAIKRNARVLVCANLSGACAATTNWANGWLVCADQNEDGTCDASTATNPNPIVIRSPIHSTLVLTANSTSPVIFNPNGTAVARTLVLSGNWSNPSTRTNTVAATGTITSTKTP